MTNQGRDAKMRLALVPPKPKEFVVAYIIGIGVARCMMRFKALSASGVVRFMVGGATRSRRARTVRPASTAPAAPSRWPVIDFVELTARPRACLPNTCSMAAVSARSPTGLDVACALRY